MKYRIKIVTYQSGRQEFFPQFKTWLRWANIYYDGDLAFRPPCPCDTREDALTRIDKHYKQNSVIEKIIFEEINKPA